MINLNHCKIETLTVSEFNRQKRHESKDAKIQFRIEPLFRITTESGDWMEIGEALQVPGGVLYRLFSIYGKHQDTALDFIPNATLESSDCEGFYTIATQKKERPHDQQQHLNI
jgi:hypothetical protein